MTMIFKIVINIAQMYMYKLFEMKFLGRGIRTNRSSQTNAVENITYTQRRWRNSSDRSTDHGYAVRQTDGYYSRAVMAM